MLIHLLNVLFHDGEVAHNLLRKHGLDSVLDTAIPALQSNLITSPINQFQLTAAAAAIVTSVNAKMQVVKDPGEKQHLELLLKQIFVHVFEKIIEQARNPGELLSSIKSGLKSACSIGGYNLDALLKLFQFDELEVKHRVTKQVTAKHVYYDWNGKDADLIDLAQNLKDHKCIASVKEFRKLFSKEITLAHRVHINTQNLELILALMDGLKAKKLITPRGGQGHFHPLTVYGVNLEGKLLSEHPPKTIKSMALKNKANWLRHSQKAASWISRYQLIGNLGVTLVKVTQ